MIELAEIAIAVNRLGKQYRIGQRERYKSLRESIMRGLTVPVRRLRSGFGSSDGQRANGKSTFWALKDVSFEVKQGEVLGIIGRNGAGKSTLLKILSRITEPTEGFVDIYGRVGSLLEVGTGFHPELTGRENVFLNGAILGMSQAEVRRKFDEIVAFAEVEQFLDTPVKHYSSGMYMRLAFAVAAHLEPDILLVDEVLAVGDATFQKKCLNKIESVGSQGRTVFFVSHNMQAVTRLCSRALLLHDGQVAVHGCTHEVARTYLHGGAYGSAARVWPDPERRPGNHVVRLCAVRVRSDDHEVHATVDIRRPVSIEMEFEVLRDGHVLVPNLHFYNDDGICAFIVNAGHGQWGRRPRPRGRYRSTVRIPGNYLAEGTLSVNVGISTLNPVIVHVLEPDAVAFEVVDSLDGNSARGEYAGPMPGVVRPILPWTDERGSERAESFAEELA
ncbi:MAG TPA: ABC transporter ATP-binding protein [Gemmataceae bacterium]|nr:ABC transporter ATP-binding protein [Gemmataceae bacterium]